MAARTEIFSRAQRWMDLRNSTGFSLRAPETLILGVNNVCNLHCVMCDVGTNSTETNFARSLTGTQPINMPMTLLQHVVDQASLFSPRPDIGFAFTEPGIYPHLVQGIAYAHGAGFRSTLTTNGFTLTKLAGGLIDAGLDRLYVSLDGPPEIHDRVRGKRGSFEAVRTGIQSLHAIKPIPTEIFFAVTNENYTHIGEFVNSLSVLSISSVTIMHTNFVTPEMAQRHNAQFDTSYRATVSSMAAFHPEAIDVSLLAQELDRVTGPDRYAFPIHVQPPILSEGDIRSYYHDHRSAIGKRCIDPWKYLMVKSNGDVIAAHGRCYDVNIGNISRDPLTVIWNSERMKTFRQTLMKAGGLLPACFRCCGGFST